MALLLLVSYQVLSRLFIILPRLFWTEEFSRLIFVWIVMIGSIIVLHNNEHFSFDLFDEFLNRNLKLKFYKNLLTEIIVFIFAIILTIYGFDFALSGLASLLIVSRISTIWLYISYFIVGFSFLLIQIERIIFIFANYNKYSKKNNSL
jgi:TRAP-type transport system small permease protein